MLKAEPIRLASADREAKAAPFLAARVFAIMHVGAGFIVRLCAQFVTHSIASSGGFPFLGSSIID